MSKRNNIILLEDITDACKKIQRYVVDLSYEEFLEDDKTIDAVIRNFEIIGEAANNLTNDIFIQYTHVQWKRIIGLRNKLIHGYFGVDYQILWQIIQENLPLFEQQMHQIAMEIEKK